MLKVMLFFSLLLLLIAAFGGAIITWVYHTLNWLLGQDESSAGLAIFGLMAGVWAVTLLLLIVVKLPGFP